MSRVACHSDLTLHRLPSEPDLKPRHGLRATNGLDKPPYCNPVYMHITYLPQTHVIDLTANLAAVYEKLCTNARRSMGADKLC